MPVEQSVAQMALTRDITPGGFMERVQTLLAVVAGSVLRESSTTPYHNARASYAQKVIAIPPQYATAAGPILVMGVNITTHTTYDEATKTSTCDATDTEIQSQIQTFWNALAGIDTPDAA